MVAEAWLRAEFEPNDRRRRMAKLEALERSYLGPPPSRPRSG
jgi:hypothetical protein